MRENLGQLESRGVDAEWELRAAAGPARWLGSDGRISVCGVDDHEVWGGPDAGGEVDGGGAAQLGDSCRCGWSGARLGVLMRWMCGPAGGSIDDTANTLELHSYTQVNAYAEHGFGERWTMYASAQNLLGSWD